MPNHSLDEKPKFPNVFKLELTPPKPVITPDVPCSMTVKNMSKEIQAVEIEVDSYLFEIIDPRAKVWPHSQVYHKVEPGGTLSFQIGIMKEMQTEQLKMDSNIVHRLKKPEGLLKIYHSTDKSMDDTDAGGWGYDENPYDIYYIMPGRRIRYLRESPSEEHGHVEMELIYEGKETELIQKKKEEFNKKSTDERLTGERWKKKEKKCCSCTVL